MTQAKYLIVVDMQNDFIDGSLGTPEAQAIVPAAVERIRRAAVLLHEQYPESDLDDGFLVQRLEPFGGEKHGL